jgi:hypothetical protein
MAARPAGLVNARLRWTYVLAAGSSGPGEARRTGSEFGFSGAFREVQPSSKIVHTQAYEPGTVGDGCPGDDAIVTVTFTEDGA